MSKSNPSTPVQMASASSAQYGRAPDGPDETDFLLGDPERARRLRRSIDDLKAGRVIRVTSEELRGFE